MKKGRDLDIRQFIVPLTLLIVFWAIAIGFWQLKENIFFLLNFGYIGTDLPCNALAHAPRPSLGDL